MRRYISFLFVLVIIIISFGTCSKNDSSPTTPIQPSNKASDYFMPQQADKRVILTGSSTLKIDTLLFKTQLDTMIMTILPGIRTSSGGKTLVILQTYNSGTGTDISFIYAGDNEILSFDSTLQEANAELFFKTPIQVGTSWKFSSIDSTLLTITSVTETVTTPVGVFNNVVKVSRTTSISPQQYTTTDMYIAKGIGIVKLKVESKSPFGTSTMNMSMELLLQSKNY